MEKNTKNIIIFLTNLWSKVKEFTFKTEVVNQIEIPEVNIPEVNFPEYPKDIRVNNIDEVKKTIEGNTDKVVASLSKELKNLIPKEKNKKVIKALKGIDKTLDKKDLTPDVIAELKKLVKNSKNKDIDLTTIENGLESLKSIFGDVKRYDELRVRWNEKQLKRLMNSLSVSVSGGMSSSGLATANRQDTAIAELQKLVGFEIPPYDYIALTYVAAGNGAGEIETAVFKDGGAVGGIVATLTLTYNASNEIATVTKT